MTAKPNLALIVPAADALLSVTNVSDRQARSAALVLAGHACDAGELAEWLEIIGLRHYEIRRPRTPCGRPSAAKGAGA